MKKKEQKPRNSDIKAIRSSMPDSAFVYSTGAVFGVLVLLRFVAALFPESRVWGLSLLAYLPASLMYTATVIGLLIVSPVLFPVFRMKAAWLEKSGGGWLPVIAAAVACAGLFWLFRMETYFLGDGAVYLAEHFRLVRGMDVSETVLYSTLSAPLSGYLLAAVSSVAWAISNGEGIVGNPQFAWRISGAIAGGVYVAIVVLGMRRFAADASVRLAGMAALLLTPGVLFFFGYVEYYTLLFVAGTAYFLASDRAARGEIQPWVPGMLLLLAVALHFMALLLLPGYLLLLYSRRNVGATDVHGLARVLLFVAGSALVLGGVWYFISGTAFEGSRVVLSLAPFGEAGAMQHYTLLSQAHLLDVLNMLMLAGGPMVVALPFMKLRRLPNATVIALAHVAFSGFLLVFGYTGFGMSRDWDVNALFGSALAVFVLAVLRGTDDSARRTWLAWLIAGSTVVAGLPWLALNIGTESSVTRFRHVMALDEELIPGDFALNGYEHLRKYYQSAGDEAGVAWAIRKKIDMVGYPDDIRKYFLAAVTTMSAGDRTEAFTWVFGHLLARIRSVRAQGVESVYAGDLIAFEEVYAEGLMQADYLALAGMMEASVARSYLDSLRKAAPGGKAVILASELMDEAHGVPLVSLDSFAQAARGIRGSSTLAAYSGRALLGAGRIEDAIFVLSTAIRLDAQFSLPSLYLGQALLQRNPPDVAEASDQLRHFLDTPGGHRVADPRAQQQLMDVARRLLRQIETQGWSAQTP